MWDKTKASFLKHLLLVDMLDWYHDFFTHQEPEPYLFEPSNYETNHCTVLRFVCPPHPVVFSRKRFPVFASTRCCVYHLRCLWQFSAEGVSPWMCRLCVCWSEYWNSVIDGLTGVLPFISRKDCGDADYFLQEHCCWCWANAVNAICLNKFHFQTFPVVIYNHIAILLPILSKKNSQVLLLYSKWQLRHSWCAVCSGARVPLSCHCPIL